jgi:16S rRNA G966 N2-methylase RsmD
MEALQAIKVLGLRGQVFDLVYVDPPFAEGLYADCLSALAGSKILQPDALVTVERHHKNNLEPNYGRLNLINERRLGDTCLDYYALGEGDV